MERDDAMQPPAHTESFNINGASRKRDGRGGKYIYIFSYM